MTNFIVFGTQRTGTTLLVKLLDSHPDILCLSEMILLRDSKGFMPYMNYKKYLKINVGSNLENYFNYIYDDSRGFSATGFKLMLDQVTKGNLELLKKFNVKILYIIRKNILQTLISNIRTSLGIYASNDNQQAEKYISTKIELGTDRLIENIKKIENAYSKMEEILISNNFEYTTLYYEDISNDYNCESVKNALSFLEINKDKKLATTFSKVGPNTLKNAISNYDAVISILKENNYYKFIY